MDNYINFENFNDLINKILPKLGIREEEINDMKFDMKRRKINGLKNKPKAIFDDFEEIINKLVELKEHKYIENIKDETSFFQNFMNSDKDRSFNKYRINIKLCSFNKRYMPFKSRFKEKQKYF